MKRKKAQPHCWREEKPIFVIGIALFVLFALVGVIEYSNPQYLQQLTPSCFVRTHVGLYCTGCGATRAVLALLHGQILKSAYYNVVVLYVVVFYGIYVVRGTLYLLSKGKYAYMRFRVCYVFAGLGIAVIQAVVKNVALYRYHYEWM